MWSSNKTKSPALDGFLDVGKSLFAGLALREAAGQRRDFCNVVTGRGDAGVATARPVCRGLFPQRQTEEPIQDAERRYKCREKEITT